jgi:hypothetical protein
MSKWAQVTCCTPQLNDEQFRVLSNTTVITATV